MDFERSLYQRYVSTHIAHRKGVGDHSRLKRQARGYRQHFGCYLPMNRDARIADLGCGSGTLVWWLQQKGYRNAHGVDASVEQVAMAQEFGIDSVNEGDVFSFLEGQNGFDVLFARDLVEHLDKQAVFDFLSLCNCSLVENGVLVLQVPNAESPYFGRVRYGDFTHKVAFTTSSIMQLLLAAGFERIDVRPWRPAVTGVSSLLRYVAWRVIEPLLKLPILIESGRRNGIVTMNLIVAARKPVLREGM